MVCPASVAARTIHIVIIIINVGCDESVIFMNAAHCRTDHDCHILVMCCCLDAAGHHTVNYYLLNFR